MCLVYNYFNYRPFEVIKRYLIEIYQKLKPGGILIMTFNDCDRVSAVKLVENKFCSYTPGYLVRELGESLGYEIEFSWNDPGPSTWIEFKKPGTLNSIRGGQALAKIKRNDELDLLTKKVYTNEDINKIKKDALEFGIAYDHNVDVYTPEELDRMIQNYQAAKKEDY
jgi:hypothetical protein